MDDRLAETTLRAFRAACPRAAGVTLARRDGQTVAADSPSATLAPTLIASALARGMAAGGLVSHNGDDYLVVFV